MLLRGFSWGLSPGSRPGLYQQHSWRLRKCNHQPPSRLNFVGLAQQLTHVFVHQQCVPMMLFHDFIALPVVHTREMLWMQMRLSNVSRHTFLQLSTNECIQGTCRVPCMCRWLTRASFCRLLSRRIRVVRPEKLSSMSQQPFHTQWWGQTCSGTLLVGATTC